MGRKKRFFKIDALSMIADLYDQLRDNRDYMSNKILSRQGLLFWFFLKKLVFNNTPLLVSWYELFLLVAQVFLGNRFLQISIAKVAIVSNGIMAVSYTHLRAHETDS